MHFSEPKFNRAQSLSYGALALFLGAGLAWFFGHRVLIQTVQPGRMPPSTSTFAVPLRSEGVEEPPLDLFLATDLLVEAIIAIESGGNPDLVGSKGERGLMQIMPNTWAELSKRHFDERISFDRAFEPSLNRQMGRLFLGDLQLRLYEHQAEWKHDLRLLLCASYNGGFARVRRADFDLTRLPKSVQDYAIRVAALHDWHLAHDAAKMNQILRLQ